MCTLDHFRKSIHPSISSIHAIQGLGGLETIPSVMGQEAGYALYRFPLHPGLETTSWGLCVPSLHVAPVPMLVFSLGPLAFSHNSKRCNFWLHISVKCFECIDLNFYNVTCNFWVASKTRKVLSMYFTLLFSAVICMFSFFLYFIVPHCVTIAWYFSHTKGK